MKLFHFRLMPAEILVDCNGKHVPGFRTAGCDMNVLFIDPTPLANWAHECFYIIVPPDGSPVKLTHLWPPAERHHESEIP